MRNSPTNYQHFSPRPNSAYRNSNSNAGRSNDQRQIIYSIDAIKNKSLNGFLIDPNGSWRNTGFFSRSPSAQRRNFSQKRSYRYARKDQPNSSTFRRPDNRPTSGSTSYEQKFPENKNQNSSNVVRLITTNDSINESSDLWPLNYSGLQTRTLLNLEISDLASISSTLPPETLKKLVVWRLSISCLQELLAQLFSTGPFVKSVSHSTQLL